MNVDDVVELDLEVELARLIDDDIGPAVVAIGGGHGLAIALRAALSYAGEITGIVSVADDGGSSGRITETTGIPPPGDIRRCLLALTPDHSVWTELFGFRFPDGGDRTGQDIEGHSLGNLLIAALTELRGDFGVAVAEAGMLLGAMGSVIPAADRPVTLTAAVGGRSVRGQAAISKTRGAIESLVLGPSSVRLRPEVLDAIEHADQILVGPGSLFTSTVAALLVPGIVPALERSAARLVFVLNLVTQDGETLGLDGLSHVAALRDLAGLTRAGVIVAHAGELEVPDGHDRVTIDEASAASAGWRVVHADIADRSASWPAHDPGKLGRVLSTL